MKCTCDYCFREVDHVNGYGACGRCDSRAVYCANCGEYTVTPVKVPGFQDACSTNCFQTLYDNYLSKY